MWDLQTALQAAALVTVASVLAPPLARGLGGICAVIGLFGAMQSSSWAPTVAALGSLAWFVGHWSFAVCHGRPLSVASSSSTDRYGAAAVDGSKVLAASQRAATSGRPLTHLVSR